MTKEELEVFYLYDEHLYLIKEHPILGDILDTLDIQFTEKNVQDYINKLISWYNIKYSDAFLQSLFDDSTNADTTILKIMSFDRLQKSYGSFEKHLFQREKNSSKKNILLKYLVVMAGWGLIYCKKSNPQYGYYRARQLLNDFNSEYYWNLSSDIYQKVFDRDYSPNIMDNKKLLEHKRNEKKKRKNHERKSFIQKIKSRFC